MCPPAVDFAVVGGLREDYFITPQGAAYLRQLGGNAVYAAAGARLWAGAVGLVARVGCHYPREWLDIMAARGLDTRGVIVDELQLDNRTFYAYRSLEERDDTHPERHFARLGLPLPPELIGYATSTEGQAHRDQISPLGLRPAEIAPDYLSARGFHLAPFDLGVHYALPAWLHAHGVPLVTCDPSVRYMLPEFSADVAAMLAQVDAFLPSAMETRAFFGGAAADLWQAAEAFAAMGPRVVVLKLGARGQFVFDAAARRKWQLPAYPARVVDVTGAGDAYCGGFLAGLAQTGDPLEAAVRACAAASFVVEGLGALYALDHAGDQLPARCDHIRQAAVRV
jgi:sugar/nucleoside kinase (ribokinase family)